jgi:hypothetical protein
MARVGDGNRLDGVYRGVGRVVQIYKT